MALNILKCNQLTPLNLKVLKVVRSPLMPDLAWSTQQKE